MPSFCLDRLAVPARLRAHHGVLRSDALAVASDAERAARLVLEEAREQAAALLEQAAAQATEAARDQRERTAREAGALLDTLRAAQARLLDGVAPLVLDLAARAFDLLVAEATPRDRIAAAVRQVCAEAPPRLVSALARMHPDDAPLDAGAPWEVRPDASLARGSCRLEAASGEWQASFDLGAAAMRAALLAPDGAEES